jgi:hypothetical protein
MLSANLGAGGFVSGSIVDIGGVCHRHERTLDHGTIPTQRASCSPPARVMRFQPALALFPLLLPLTLVADPADDLREAVTALSRTSYAWETTTRQRFNGEAAEPRLNPNAPIDVKGKIDPDGYTELTQMPSRELPVPVTAVLKQADVVAHTPIGWKRRTEMRQNPGPDREVTFEGKPVRLSRFFSVALKATALRPLTDNLFDLMGDMKSFRNESGLIIAELRDKAVEQLWGDAQAKRAPEIQGTVIFKFNDQGLAEYHLVLAIGFPNSRTKKIAWTMQQWTTRISGIGSTRVEPPEGAIKALEQ